MNTLGCCFSSERTYRVLFSKNIHLKITLKPRKQIFDDIGNDSMEFRMWEIFGLEHYLLLVVDRCYNAYGYGNDTKKSLSRVIDELESVYSGNFFYSSLKRGLKDDIWIKLYLYIQDFLGLASYYEAHLTKYNRVLEEEDRINKEKDTQFKLISASIAVTAIFISLAALVLNNHTLLFPSLGDNTSPSVVTNMIGISIGLAIALLSISIVICLLVLKLSGLSKRK